MLGGKHEGAVRPDARIEDVLPTLADPEDFVRGILGKFHDEKFDRDKAVVRIGISGKRRQPHYSIEESEGTETLPDGTTMRGYRRRAVFHGRIHKRILNEEAKGISWSSSAATYEEVKSILGMLRATKKGY